MSQENVTTLASSTDSVTTRPSVWKAVCDTAYNAVITTSTVIDGAGRTAVTSLSAVENTAKIVDNIAEVGELNSRVWKTRSLKAIRKEEEDLLSTDGEDSANDAESSSTDASKAA